MNATTALSTAELVLDLILENGKRSRRVGYGTDMQEAFAAFDMMVKRSVRRGQVAAGGKGSRMLPWPKICLAGERYETVKTIKD